MGKKDTQKAGSAKAGMKHCGKKQSSERGGGLKQNWPVNSAPAPRDLPRLSRDFCGRLGRLRLLGQLRKRVLQVCDHTSHFIGVRVFAIQFRRDVERFAQIVPGLGFIV